MVKKDDSSQPLNEIFGFDINVDFFSERSTTSFSLGMVKLQRWNFKDDSLATMTKLLYINWNKQPERCRYTRPPITGDFEINLLMWISTKGHLNVKLNGEKMILDSECEDVNMWSEVNRVKVSLFAMKPYHDTVNQLFMMNYELYQATSEL